MYICICNGVTERQIIEAARCGARDLADLTGMTGCAGTCGSCAELAVEVLDANRPATAFSVPILSISTPLRAAA